VTPCATSRAILVALGVIAGAAGGYWYARPPASVPESAASGAERKILCYRDPTGAPFRSAEPKKDASGRDWLPVFEDEEISFEPGGRKPTLSTGGSRKILYYRNPMGLPDTSPVPKKDWMGMDYIPVYEGEEQDDGKTAKVSLDKVQRSGVRTEKVEERIIVRPVRGVGTVTHDESRLTIVAMRSEGYVEELFVNGRSAPDHVEPRHRRRGDAAHRRSDDRRHGVVDVAHADRHSVDLCGGEGSGAAGRAFGAVSTASMSSARIRAAAAPFRPDWSWNSPNTLRGSVCQSMHCYGTLKCLVDHS
jgi:hypothetical protein